MAEKKKSLAIDPELKKRLAGLYGHMAKRLGIRGAPKIFLSHNAANAKRLACILNPPILKLYPTAQDGCPAW